jgi:Flp pilus assembly protein TadB
MTLTWLLLGAALLLAGGDRRGSLDRAPISPRALQLLTGGALAGLSVAVLGVGRGVLVAVVVAPLAAVAVARLQARPARVRADPSLALALDLVAVILRSGRPIADALTLAAASAGTSGPQLVRVGGLLRLGADPARAWRAAAHDPVLAPVAAAAVRSAHSGIRLAATFEDLAADLRAQLVVAARARAERAGVLAAAPLGLCFLPAFVLLGVVPSAVGLLASTWAPT